MTNLLLDEPPLIVLPSLAVAVGLNEAIILQQIHYWLKQKLADPDRHADTYREDRWWVYNTVEGWRKQFPFWSGDTIERALTSLRTRGVVTAKKLASDPRDRTNWYTIDYERLAEVAGGDARARSCNDADCGSASPQLAVMGSPQVAAVHQRRARRSLTKTSAENSQRVQQQTAPPAEPSPSPQIVADVVVERFDLESDERKRPDADHPSRDGDDRTEEDELFDDGAGDAPDAKPVLVLVGSSTPLVPAAVAPDTPSPQQMLVAELVSEGMGLSQARKAVAEKYDAAAMQLENLRRALPTEKLIPDDRGKWLHVAIRDGYGPTKGYAKYLENQRTTQRRKEAQEKRNAAQRAKDDAERILFEEVELESEAKAALMQKARNCVHPDWRRIGEEKCAKLIRANFESLVLGQTLKEFPVWPAPETDSKQKKE